MTLEEHARRSLARRGEACTITSYTETGTDDYGDPEFSATTTTAVGLFRQPYKTDNVKESGGLRVEADARVYVSDEYADVIVPAASGSPRASELVRDATGERYRVGDVWSESNGQLRVALIEVSD